MPHSPADHAEHHGREGHQGHDHHAGHSVAMFRDKFWGSVALTVPTLIWSPMIQRWLHFQAPTFPGSYNIAAIPLAAGVFAHWGIVLNPAVGAILMSFSTVVVALNAQLLRRATL
jgi:Cu2+-exporting ATPase